VIQPFSDQASQYVLTANLTANRTLTLGVTGPPSSFFLAVRIVRTSTDAHTYTIIDGGPAATTLYIFPASQTRDTGFTAVWNGTDWIIGNNQYLT
jgi:hypothetical protein